MTWYHSHPIRLYDGTSPSGGLRSAYGSAQRQWARLASLALLIPWNFIFWEPGSHFPGTGKSFSGNRETPKILIFHTDQLCIVSVRPYLKARPSFSTKFHFPGTGKSFSGNQKILIFHTYQLCIVSVRPYLKARPSFSTKEDDRTDGRHFLWYSIRSESGDFTKSCNLTSFQVS